MFSVTGNHLEQVRNLGLKIGGRGLILPEGFGQTNATLTLSIDFIYY